jgi:hypothetical protein
MSAHSEEFIKLMTHPVKFRMFLLSKLPSAYFTGVRVNEASEKKCVVSVPYKWFSKNPFRSTYFASLAMAAEMSTGALSMSHLYKRQPTVSMLLVKLEAEYFKKATGKSFFTCEDGEMIKEAIDQTVRSSEPRSVRAKSTGRNAEGEIIAEFFITWSFKARVGG